MAVSFQLMSLTSSPGENSRTLKNSSPAPRLGLAASSTTAPSIRGLPANSPGEGKTRARGRATLLLRAKRPNGNENSRKRSVTSMRPRLVNL